VQGLEAVSSSLDSIFNMATAMKDESVQQNLKIEQLRDGLGRTTEKTIGITSRQKHQLR
jgi:hypothetical protein